MEAAWQRCSTFLQDEIPAQQFNTWIRPLRASEENNQLQLIAPNRFIRDWVQDKYAERIRELVNQVSNGRISRVVLDTHASNIGNAASGSTGSVSRGIELAQPRFGKQAVVNEQSEAEKPIDRRPLPAVACQCRGKCKWRVG